MSIFQVTAIVVTLLFSAYAVAQTVKGVRSMVAVIRSGQPSLPRTAQPVGRTVTMVKETLLHTRMLQWTVVGVMHWFVYAAFIVLSAAVATAYLQLFDPEFQLPLIGHFFLYEWLGEGLGVLGTIGIVYLAYYRQKHHPRREGRDSRFYRSTMWQAYFVEAFVLVEGSAILFIRGAEYNLGQLTHPAGSPDADHYTRFHFPVSSFFGDLLYPSGAGSEATLENLIIAIAVVKIVLAMIWLLVISRNLTMGVAWHRFTAWPNIWFKRESSGRTALGAVKPLTSGGTAITLDDVDDLDEDALLGVGSIEDFSWKNILDFTTCTECGRCQSQCPAWNTEKPLSPKLLITALRDATYAKSDYTRAVKAGGEGAGVDLLEGNDVLTKEANRPLVAPVEDGDWFYNPESGAAVIDPEVLWNCTSCGACVQQCPVDIEHVDHIIDMRRYAVLVESNFPSQLNGLFKGLEQKGNPWNMSPTARLDWTKGLDFEVKVVGAPSEEGGIESLDEVEWLFWVGCAGAYEDRAKKTTRAVAELLDMAGVSFGVLGNGETCTGDPARRAGNEFVFQGLATQNVETLTEAKVKKVVSTCAHCFNTLKNEYRDFGIELEVIHHTQLLNRLVREGKLTPVGDGAGAHKRSITYHDPCYIGRHNGVYEPPRELLQVLPGADFVEMERNSERSFCCGAGGARMWMEENIGSRINVNRTIEAVGTGADQIAVGCPFCRVMLSDGLTAQQAKGEAREEVEVLDVAQMLLASVKGEMATKLAPGAAPAAVPAAKKKAETPGAAQVAETPEISEPDAKDAAQDTQEEAPGPVAKAAGGGSSLFDDPAPSQTADGDASPAEEAQAAKPASSGGSLFDVGGDEPAADPEPAPAPAATSGGSLFDVPADEPAPAAAKAAEPEPAAEPAKSEPAASTDLGGGGSLFDIPAAEPAAAKTEPTPEAEAAPEPEPTPEPEAAAAQPQPTTDLGAGGSLFDIQAPEPAAAKPAAPEPEAAAQPEPQPEPAATAEPEASTSAPAAAPSVDLNSGGSLFDIQAPEPAAAKPAAPEPEAAAQPEPVAVAEPEPQPEPVAVPEPEPEPAAKVAPRRTTGSLFDIAAPAAAASAPAAPAAAEPVPEPEPEPVPAAEPEPELTPAQQVSAAATAAANNGEDAPDQAEAAATVEETEDAPADAQADAAEAELADEEVEAAVEAEDEPAVTTEPQPKPTSSGASHTPKTDVDISGAGSLFDL